jgi:hypothetical protein
VDAVHRRRGKPSGGQAVEEGIYLLGCERAERRAADRREHVAVEVAPVGLPAAVAEVARPGEPLVGKAATLIAPADAGAWPPRA